MGREQDEHKTAVTVPKSMTEQVLEQFFLENGVPEQYKETYKIYVTRLNLENITFNELLDFLEIVEKQRGVLYQHLWVKEARFDRTTYDKISPSRFKEFFEAQFTQANLQGLLQKILIKKLLQHGLNQASYRILGEILGQMKYVKSLQSLAMRYFLNLWETKMLF